MESDNGSIIATYWREFLLRSPEAEPARSAGYQAWGFGNSPAMADSLGGLVVRGVKTATASLVWSYEDGTDPYPEVGGYSIILDGQGLPLCIIRTTRIDIKPFDEVDAEQAFLEGEGDRSLAYWREAHWEFFSQECGLLGREPDMKMPVLCERFEIVYP